MKKGIGIEDFREIIREDCYYVDKTNYIEKIRYNILKIDFREKAFMKKEYQKYIE